MLARFFRHDSCDRKLKELSDRLETAERRLRSLDAEFTDLYDQTKRQVERLVKRERREVERAAEALPEEEPRAAAPPAPRAVAGSEHLARRFRIGG